MTEHFLGTLPEPYLPKDGDPENFQDYFPPYESIPEDFKLEEKNEWRKFIYYWIQNRGLEDPSFYAKPELENPYDARKHLAIMLGATGQLPYSYVEPATAYLLSLWFDGVAFNEDGGIDWVGVVPSSSIS